MGLVPFNNLLRPRLFGDSDRSTLRLAMTYLFLAIAVGAVFLPLLITRRLNAPLLEKRIDHPAFQDYLSLEGKDSLSCGCTSDFIDPRKLFGDMNVTPSYYEAIVAACTSSGLDSIPADRHPYAREPVRGLCVDLLGDGTGGESYFTSVLAANVRLSLRGNTLVSRDSLPVIFKEVVSLQASLYTRASTSTARTAVDVLNRAVRMGALEGSEDALGTLEIGVGSTSLAAPAVAEFVTARIMAKFLSSLDESFKIYFDECKPVFCTYLVGESLFATLLYTIAVVGGIFGMSLSAVSFIYRVMDRRIAKKMGSSVDNQEASSSSSSSSPPPPPPLFSPTDGNNNNNIRSNNNNNNNNNNVVTPFDGMVPSSELPPIFASRGKEK